MKQLVYAEPVNNEELRLRIEDAPQKKKKKITEGVNALITGDKILNKTIIRVSRKF
jgi:hypothetical protein